MHPTILTRRRFLKQSAGLAAGTLSATLLDMYKWAAAAPTANDYGALVCVFLFGGNDSANTVVPRAGAANTVYTQARGPLAIPASSLLPIDPVSAQPVALGLAPQLTELHALFQQGKLAILHNVGALAAPITRAQYKAKSVPLPPSLFAHDEQQEQWQSARQLSVGTSGWGGRIADLLNSLNGNAKVSLSISLAGTNTLQVGNQVAQYSMSPSGTFALHHYDPSYANPWTKALQSIFAQTRANLLEREWNQRMRRAIDAAAAISAALNSTPALATPFPANPFGEQMLMTARLIAARNQLAVRRQIFFTALGGFDTHGAQQRDHPPLLTALSKGMAALYNASVELGVANNLTLFTASEFGRTLVQNGEGTDHGWGADQFILGGSVRGGECYGRYPNVQLGGPDDEDAQGRWIPTTAVDQYAATLAKWFGVSAADIPIVTPNIDRFASRDLGFVS